jgi:hypothetical protein
MTLPWQLPWSRGARKPGQGVFINLVSSRRGICPWSKLQISGWHWCRNLLVHQS